MPLRSNVVSTCASIDSEGTLTLTGKPSGLVSRSSSLFKTTLANNSSTSLDKSCGSPNSNDSHQSEVPELKLFNKRFVNGPNHLAVAMTASTNPTNPAIVCIRWTMAMLALLHLL